MDISQAKRLQSPRKRRKRVGRGIGSGHGKTSTRGRDGARSRSGWSSRGRVGGNLPLFRRLPKVGFSNARFKVQHSIVKVGQLAAFEPGSLVTAESLKEKGLLKQTERGGVKVLGDGELDRALTVRVDAVSASARKKIEAAGGKVELIPPPKKPVRNKMKPKPQKQAESI
jgi:large subunit ribosomal protein L15